MTAPDVPVTGPPPAPERAPFPITQPGVYPDLPEEDYHADPVFCGSMSSTGARKILPPNGSPATFRHCQDNPAEHKREFDIGHAAHMLVLGQGSALAPIRADNYKTKAAQNSKRDAYAAGQIPLLPKEVEQVKAMAAQLKRHPIASQLFQPGTGVPEQSLFWEDDQTKVWRRARLDWLSTRRLPDGRLIVPDYKTGMSAERTRFMRSAVDHGYHQQAAWYIDAVVACGLAEDAAFLFVVQEKVAPYIVGVLELDHVALMWGRELNARALDVYRHCTTTGQWPGYDATMTPDGWDIDIQVGQLPGWAERQAEEATGA